MSTNDTVTIVSGLPRSGTSMMMRMLAAGGLDALTDNIRGADVDNPRGYFELEKAKAIERDSSWLPATRGKVFKMVSMLLFDLPPTEAYKVVFMERDIVEVLVSQHKMLKRLGRAPGNPDPKLATSFRTHLAKLDAWLQSRQDIEMLRVDYGAVIGDPRKQAKRVAAFLDCRLDVDAMVQAVDSSLYRNRLCPSS